MDGGSRLSRGERSPLPATDGLFEWSRLCARIGALGVGAELGREPVTELGHGFVTQFRVIHALALRETRTRFGAHQLGYIWALLEPAFWIATFWAMFKVIDRGAPGGMDIIPFLVTGLIPYELAVKTADKTSLSIDSNRALLFYPHVQPLDLIIARGSLEIATSITVFVILLGGVALYDHSLVIDNPLQVMFGLGLAGMFGTTLGTVLCAAAVLTKTIDRLKGPIMRPLFWVSGIYFTANALPTFARDYLMLNPVLHCVEIVRDGWFPSYHGTHADPMYVIGWIVGMAVIGLTLERRIRTKVTLS